jgi:hypothetical protein
VTVEEVGTSPPEVLDEVLRGVQERAGEPEPPVAVPRESWYPKPMPSVEVDAPLDPDDPPDLGEPSVAEKPR